MFLNIGKGLKMAKPKITETTIDKLIPDDCNFNEGTEFGDSMIERSLTKFGAGRSILLDKNNRIIAGNKTTEKFANIGLENVLIVDTDGETLVAVRRNDIDLDTERGREMAIADNATSKANLKWNDKLLMHCASKMKINMLDWGIKLKGKSDAEASATTKPEKRVKMIVEGESERISKLLNELQKRGFTATMM